MALHNLWYMAETLYNILIHTASLKIYAYIGTCGIAKAFRVNIETASCNYIIFNKMLHALMNGST
jgi:hypothetical protein